MFCLGPSRFQVDKEKVYTMRMDSTPLRRWISVFTISSAIYLAMFFSHIDYADLDWDDPHIIPMIYIALATSFVLASLCVLIHYIYKKIFPEKKFAKKESIKYPANGKPQGKCLRSLVRFFDKVTISFSKVIDGIKGGESV